MQHPDPDSLRRATRIEGAATNYQLDRKLILLSAIIEVIVGLTSMLGAAVWAAQFGKDLATQAMMMLPVAALAAVESVRIPLAIKSQTHASRFMRMLALLGLLFSTAITGKQLAQVTDMGLEPRLTVVHMARGALDAARQDQTTSATQLQLAKDEVADRQRIYDETQARLRSAGDSLSHLPRCRNCGTGASEGALRENLRSSNSAVAAAKKEWDAAMLRLSHLDPAAGSQAVRTAEIAFRAAISSSQLHMFAGSLLGIEAGKVSDDEIAWLMRFLIVVPAVLAAFTASLLAMVAVTPIKRPSTDIPDVLEVVKFQQAKIVQLNAALKTAREAASKPANDEPGGASNRNGDEGKTHAFGPRPTGKT